MRLMKRLLALSILSISAIIVQSSSMAIEDTNAKIKAIFVYNFTKYIEWPSASKAGDFKIAIYGANPSLQEELNKMAQVKKAGVQTIKVSTSTDLGSIGKCHIIYVTPDFSSKLSSVLSNYTGKNTLVVTEKSGLIDKGSGINFVTIDNKQKFELNQGAIKKQSLNVSSKFLPFAHVVK